MNQWESKVVLGIHEYLCKACRPYFGLLLGLSKLLTSNSVKGKIHFVHEFKKTREKNTNPLVNRIFKESSVYRGLLIVKSFDNKRMREVDRVVIPPSYLDSILTVLHIRLNHPRQSQLRTVFERYFFSPRLDAALSDLYNSCHLCISV